MTLRRSASICAAVRVARSRASAPPTSDCARSFIRPGRVAVLVAQDLAAVRIGRGLRDFGHLHRQRVREAGMAAGVRQPDRVVRRHAAERVVQRKAFDVRGRHLRPLFLVPAAADDPFAGLRLLRRVADHADDLVPVLGGAELQVARRLADAGEVHVRVDEAGHGERALEVDHAGARADVALDVLVRSERDDRVAVDGERLCLRARLVDGDDLPAAQHQIRRPHRGRRGSRRRLRRLRTRGGNPSRRSQQQRNARDAIPSVHMRSCLMATKPRKLRNTKSRKLESFSAYSACSAFNVRQ